MNKVVLRNRNLMLLVMGRMVSLFGTSLQNLALSLYVLKVTKSATMFASVLAVSALPRLFFGPFAGVLVDLFDRKKIIVSLDILSGLVVGSVAIFYFIFGKLSMPIIYGQALLLSSVSMFFDPAIGTVIPSVVEKEYLTEANSLDSLSRSITTFIAPATSAFIFTKYGIFTVLCINTLSFFLSAISEMFIQMPNIKAKTALTWQLYKTQLKEGFQYILKQKKLFMLMTVTFFINFGFVPFFFIGILLVCKRFYLGTDMHYGFLQSVTVIATFLAPFIVSKFKHKPIFDMIIKALYVDAFIVAVIGLIATGWFVNYNEFSIAGFAVFVGLLFALITLVTFGNILVGTYFHTVIPNEMLGRIDAIMGTLALGAIPLGQMVFGYLYEAYNLGVTLIGQSIIIVVPMMAFALYIKVTEGKEKIVVEQ